MNLLNLFAMSGRIYASRIGSYLYASAAYALSFAIATGIAIAFLIVDGAIALIAGPGGAWIQNPLAAAAVAASTLAGGLCFFYLVVASAGAYMHTCAKIGAGQQDTGVAQYVEYMAANSHSFFAIAIVPHTIWAAACTLFIGAAILLMQINSLAIWAALILCGGAWICIQIPFWFSFAAKVIEKKHSYEAIGSSLYVLLKKPIAALAIIFVIIILAAVPLASALFYPIYFFVFLCPFASILTLGFYEVQRGLLK
ncbi:MAG: hypothetical protein V1822_03775 [Candidatus Micrarchaeota archaeon]